MTNPAAYWRSSKTWQKYLGRTGKVLAATTVHVAPPQLTAFAPYDFAVIQLDDTQEKIECMAAGTEKLTAGDHVRCILRKLAISEPHELIPYGIKVEKVVL